ncbi:hypothetical protein LQW54_006031 [Pestalotiopsis sp. IQ-011]
MSRTTSRRNRRRNKRIKAQKKKIQSLGNTSEDQKIQIQRLQTKLRRIGSVHGDMIRYLENEYQTDLDTCEHQIESLKDDLKSFSDNHDKETKRLLGEVERYKKAHHESQARVLDLQPRLRNISPKEISKDFDDLCAEVDDWVENRVGKVFHDRVKAFSLYEHICQDWEGAGRFLALLGRHEDLVAAAKYPDTSQDIIAALIWRFLYDEIFSQPFYHLGTDFIDMVEQLTSSMAEEVKLKRSDAALRNWTNEAYSNIMAHPGFAYVRARSLSWMSYSLADSLYVLMPSMTLADVRESISEHILDRAMQLQEKIKTSDSLYYIRLTRYGSDDLSRMQLVRDHRWTALGDVFNHLAELDRDAELPPTDHADYLPTVLSLVTPVCTTAPALMETRVGEREYRRTRGSWHPYSSEDLGEDVCLRKQKHMFAWAEAPELEERLRKEPQGIVDAIRMLNV